MTAKICAVLFVGALLSACTSSTQGSSGSAGTSSAGTSVETSAVPSGGFLVDLDTRVITPLQWSVANAGAYYAASPDQMLAYSSCCDPPAPVMLGTINGERQQRVTQDGWDGLGAGWSPDGSHVVFQQLHMSADELGNLFVYDLTTRHRTRISNFDEGRSWGWWFTFPSFAPDGRSVLFQLPRGNPDEPAWDLWSVPVGGGKEKLVQRDAAWGGYAPDGRLAYLSPVNASTFTGKAIRVQDEPGGPARVLLQGGAYRWVRWSPDGTRISYADGGSVHVVDVATGTVLDVAPGNTAEWFDDHTLLVGPGG